MIGSTCLQAMIVPRRLIAQTRSKASSVSSSSGLSPPPMLTPTFDAAHVAFDGSERLGLRKILSWLNPPPHPITVIFFTQK
jgi:hypothetical protein